MLKVDPVSFRDACTFVSQYHRHHRPPQGHKFSLGCFYGDDLLGVIIVGRPVSRHQNDPRFNGGKPTLEITRIATNSALIDRISAELWQGGKHKLNVVSKMISAALKRVKGMRDSNGDPYKRLITYTLQGESGISLRASNFKVDGISRGGSWHNKKRPRIDKHPITPKIRWSFSW